MEIFESLQGFVADNLGLLADVETAWQPTDFLPDLTAPDWRERLTDFREAAVNLPDEVLVVLVGNMVTEEALPSYAIRLQEVAHDETGADPSPWAKWLRGWTSEENRHETFYTRTILKMLEMEPETVVLSIRNVLRGLVAMPGSRMNDGHDPHLFDHFAAVSQRLGTYTVRDYASIIKHLVEAWKLADLSLTGKAAKAQDYLCRQPERYENLAEQIAPMMADQPPRPFRWIHDRVA